MVSIIGQSFKLRVHTGQRLGQPRIVICYELRKEANKWAKVLDYFVNVSLIFVALNTYSLEVTKRRIAENFWAIIKLLSKYDQLLQEVISGLNIQNDLTQLLSKKVENILLKQIE